MNYNYGMEINRSLFGRTLELANAANNTQIPGKVTKTMQNMKMGDSTSTELL